MTATIDQIRAERELAEARAAERAASLAPGDYYAASEWVMLRRPGDKPLLVLSCESHWNACLVLLALAKPA